MSKQDNFNIMLILQDIESLYSGNIQNNITSTAGSLAAGIKKDGFDNQDLSKLMLDQAFDQSPQGIMQKIQNNVALNYEKLEQLLNKNKDWNGLIALQSMSTNNPDFQTLGNSLANCVKTIEKKQSGGIVHKAGEKCGTSECAEFSNGYLRELGYGTWGNAWALNEVEPVYSGYDVSKRPTQYNEKDVSQYNFDASDNVYKHFDSNTLDKNQVYVVNMFYRDSSNLPKAYYGGKDGVSGTHTGYLKFNPDTNRWVVVHNIHDNIHVDDFIGIQGRNNNWGVTAIYKPLKSQSLGERIKSRVRKHNRALGEMYQTLSQYPSPAFFAEGGQFETNDNWLNIYVGTKEYKVLVASSEKEKEEGLQNVESLEPNEGMLFDYLDDPQQEISFWMKDTTVKLDIIFINDKFKVEEIKTGIPLSEELLTCVPKDGVIVYVLEVPFGSEIKIGDRVTIGKSENDEESEELEEIEQASLEILGSDGEVQAVLKGGERIFSIKNTKTLVSMAKRAYESQSDSDYKALGRKIFEYMDIQDNRDPEYVSEN